MGITIWVKLASILKKYAAGDPEGFAMHLPSQSMVIDLIRALDIPPEMVGVAIINGERAESLRYLNDGDQVLLWPPMVAGG